MRKVAFHTLGCKLNFSETSAIARQFADAGYERTEFSEGADIFVINTCSVTANADKECRKIVNKALNISPHAYVAIIGCYAQLKPNEIAAIEGVDIVLGANEKFNMIAHIDSLEKRANAEVLACDIADVHEFNQAYSVGDRTRTFLKVQDGCDYNCSFCTIPMARGRSRSDSIVNAVASAQDIASQGVKEIVLTGVNLGDFGKDQSGKIAADNSFIDLARALDRVRDIHRFRISSIEPNLLTDEVISFVARSQRFVPHFHIPLQSGSDTMLKAMRRRYLTSLYTSRIERIKTLMPHCCIGVDVITGFPGETEAEFLATYQYLNQLDISYLHVFTYSERANTSALQLEGVVPQAVRKQRTKMLRILSDKKLRAFYSEHVGKVYEVLLESDNKDGFMHGFTANYIKVKMAYNLELINTLQTMKLTGVDGTGEMLAHVVNVPAVDTFTFA